jgi:exonuclease III
MEKELKVVTYNIDGLPEQLDLRELPWLLRPLAWAYKLIKKTFLVTINDGVNRENNTTWIGRHLLMMSPDLVALQEDFNYHDTLMRNFSTLLYSEGTYQGGFDLKKIFKTVEIWSRFPLPRFKMDGLNLLMRRSRVKMICEDIVSWDKCYGYANHANDQLTHKGFRCYTVRLDDEVLLDIYVVHMDADFYNPISNTSVKKDVEARESQCDQLVRYIQEKGRRVPSIIMGDTNCSPEYSWDDECIVEHLLTPLRNDGYHYIVEAVPLHDDTRENVPDRVFSVNHINSPWKITCYHAAVIHLGLSDHEPVEVKFVLNNGDDD